MVGCNSERLQRLETISMFQSGSSFLKCVNGGCLKCLDVTVEKKVTKWELEVGRKLYGESRKWEVPFFLLVLLCFLLLHTHLTFILLPVLLQSFQPLHSIPLSSSPQLSLAWFRLIPFAFLPLLPLSPRILSPTTYSPLMDQGGVSVPDGDWATTPCKLVSEDRKAHTLTYKCIK